MNIFEKGNVRVLQHPFLTLFHVQKWMEGDDPRSYGRCFKWCNVKETRCIKEVNKIVRELCISE